MGYLHVVQKLLSGHTVTRQYQSAR